MEKKDKVKEIYIAGEKITNHTDVTMNKVPKRVSPLILCEDMICTMEHNNGLRHYIQNVKCLYFPYSVNKVSDNE